MLVPVTYLRSFMLWIVLSCLLCIVLISVTYCLFYSFYLHLLGSSVGWTLNYFPSFIFLTLQFLSDVFLLQYCNVLFLAEPFLLPCSFIFQWSLLDLLLCNFFQFFLILFNANFYLTLLVCLLSDLPLTILLLFSLIILPFFDVSEIWSPYFLFNVSTILPLCPIPHSWP